MPSPVAPRGARRAARGESSHEQTSRRGRRGSDREHEALFSGSQSPAAFTARYTRAPKPQVSSSQGL
eukprot:scaffold10351_cov62-Phaeocystis_antarctica.AAC.14